MERKAILKTIDVMTGEEVAGVVATIPEAGRSKVPYKQWAVVNLDCSALFSLNASEQRVVYLLWSALTLKGDGVVEITQVGIANRLGMQSSQVSRTLAGLREKKVVAKIGRGYMISPGLVWRGDMAQQQSALVKFLEALA